MGTGRIPESIDDEDFVMPSDGYFLDYFRSTGQGHVGAVLVVDDRAKDETECWTDYPTGDLGSATDCWRNTCGVYTSGFRAAMHFKDFVGTSRNCCYCVRYRHYWAVAHPIRLFRDDW